MPRKRRWQATPYKKNNDRRIAVPFDFELFGRATQTDFVRSIEVYYRMAVETAKLTWSTLKVDLWYTCPRRPENDKITYSTAVDRRGGTPFLSRRLSQRWDRSDSCRRGNQQDRVLQAFRVQRRSDVGRLGRSKP